MKRNGNDLIALLIFIIGVLLFAFVGTVFISNYLSAQAAEQEAENQKIELQIAQEEQTRKALEKQKAEEEKKQQEFVNKIEQQNHVTDIKEQKGQVAKQQEPPLTKSQGVRRLGKYDLTGYSSNTLYHFRTAQGRLDDSGMYRDGNGNEGCYVVSMNSSYGYGTYGLTINIGIPVMVGDSGCNVGIIDMYCAG